MPNKYPRGAPHADPNVNYYQDWELTNRPAMFPFLAEYTNTKTGEKSGGMAMPSMVTSPANALWQLVGPQGGMWDIENPQNADALREVNLATLGGEAFPAITRNALAKEAIPNALSRGGEQIGLSDYLTSIGKGFAHPGEATTISPRLTDAYARTYAKKPSDFEMNGTFTGRLANDVGDALTAEEHGYMNALMQTRPKEPPTFGTIEGGQGMIGKAKPFFERGFSPDDGGSVTSNAAYGHYVGWADRNGIPVMGLPEFSRQMADQGFNKQRIGGQVRYTGIDLNQLLSDTAKPNPLGAALASNADLAATGTGNSLAPRLGEGSPLPNQQHVGQMGEGLQGHSPSLAGQQGQGIHNLMQNGQSSNSSSVTPIGSFLDKNYYPSSGLNPIHEVHDWSKVRALARAAIRGDHVPGYLYEGQPNNGNLLAGTHRAAANELLDMLGYRKRIDHASIDDVMDDPASYGLTQSDADNLRDAVAYADYGEIDNIWDISRDTSLFSDTGRPSLMGSALASEQSQNSIFDILRLNGMY